MNKKLQKQVKKLIKLNDYFLLLLVTGILVLINYIFSMFPVRLDLSQYKSYTLSGQSKEIVKDLDDIVNIKVYLSENLPAQMRATANNLKDLLEEYDNASFGKIKVSYISPGEDPNLSQEAQSLGVPKLQFSNIESEQFQLTQGYFGLAVLYGDKFDPLPVIQEGQNLEYELTSRLAKITRDEPIQIAFSSGHGEPSVEEGYQGIGQLLSQEYAVSVQEISTESGELLSTENNLIVISSPTKEFTPEETYMLDQYVMQGGSIIIFGSGINIDQSLQASQLDLGVNDWLSSFGMKINSDLVLDTSSEIAPFNTGVNTFFVPYPFWVKVLADGISDHPAISNLQTVLLPWTSSLQVDEKKGTKVLLSSSDSAWSQEEVFNLDPTQDYESQNIKPQKFTLSALAEGELVSAFDSPPALFKDVSHSASTSKGKIAVIPSGNFIHDNFLQRFQTNAIFMLNLAEYMASDINLSDIRAKAETQRPLAQLSDQQKSLIKYGNILGIAVLVGILGLIYYQKRNK